MIEISLKPQVKKNYIILLLLVNDLRMCITVSCLTKSYKAPGELGSSNAEYLEGSIDSNFNGDA